MSYHVPHYAAEPNAFVELAHYVCSKTECISNS